MTRVFISYSQDSDEHKARVLALARRLEGDGIDVDIDRDLSPGGPDEGFNTWSEKLASRAGRVLMVFNEAYRTCWDGEQPPGRRSGATLETKILKQRVNQGGAKIEFCRAVYFESAHKTCIPDLLADLRSFSLADDYADLLAWLRPAGQPAPKPNPALAWPAPAADYRWPLADRKQEFELFRQMAAGGRKERVLLVRGERNRGKTTLLGALKDYAKAQGLPTAWVDFKGCPTMDEVYGQLRLGLRRSGLPIAHDAPLSFIEGLQERAEPLVLLFDTYEYASDEARNWLERRLLPYIDEMPAVVAVVGGQQIPDHAKSAWQKHAIPLALTAIDQPEDWLEYIRHRWPEAETPETVVQLRFVTQATGGVAGDINALLERFFEPSALAREYPP
jgi:hypothetical protein